MEGNFLPKADPPLAEMSSGTRAYAPLLGGVRKAGGGDEDWRQTGRIILIFFLFFLPLSAPPACAAPASTRIEIKARQISGRDMTQEQCLQLINSISLSKDLRGAKLDEIDISGKSLVSANLSEASLKKSILKDTKLGRANLSKANLEGAILYQSDLNGANLNSANLKNANLIKANLKNATLIGADLSKAILIEADFSGANLTGAAMEKAKTNGAVFIGTIMPDGQVHP
jgi:hypothetical protein